MYLKRCTITTSFQGKVLNFKLTQINTWDNTDNPCVLWGPTKSTTPPSRNLCNHSFC